MFNRSAFENSLGGGVATMEVPGKDGKERRLPFVPLQRTEIGGELLGPLAAITVTHTYRFRRAQCDKVVEAIYRFPMPGDAAVTGVLVSFGDVEIRAELRERQEAEQAYAEAVEQGKQALLMRRESPDVFTLRVAGIKPDEDVVVETTYVQLARPDGAGWSVRLPLTVGARYSREDEAHSAHAAGQPLALARDPGHFFTLDVLAAGVEAVGSTTHALSVSDEDGRSRVRLADRRALPDRDCVLTWRPRQGADRSALLTFVHEDPAEKSLYFLALVTPPAAANTAAGVGREIVMMKDNSGSMGGPKWEAADWAVKRFLSDLGERDAFALQVFHNEPRWFAKGVQRADAKTVAAAQHFVDTCKDSGGTELGVALEQAVRLPKQPGEWSRHVVVVTDVEVSDFGRILRLAEEEARSADRRRISVLCIDAAPNSLLATELAERGGGVARFLTSDPSQGDIASALDEVLADWSQPVLTGLRLEVDRPSLAVAARDRLPAAETGWSAVDLGDLPSGRSVWIIGRVPRGEGPLRLRLRDGRGNSVAEAKAEPGAEPALKPLFGARRVLGLEFLEASGRSAEEVNAELARLSYEIVDEPATGKRPLYAENKEAERKARLRALLVRESLRYGLLSNATAFVAVRAEAGRRVEERVLVANALPTGWDERFAAVTAAPMMSALVPPMASASTLRAMPRIMADVSSSHTSEEIGLPDGTDFGLSTPPRFKFASSPAERARKQAKQFEPLVYEGVPDLRNGECVLHESVAGDGARPSNTRLVELRLEFPGGTPDPTKVGPGLVLLLYVGDLATPRARMRLIDLLRQGGTRPLNLAVAAGDVVRLVLRDECGAWAFGAPRIQVWLRGR